MRLTLGCAACGQLIDSKLLREGDTCPRCRQGTLSLLDGGPGMQAHSVMVAWLLREASERIVAFGVVSGALTGFVLAGLATIVVDGAWAVLLFGYLGVTGALAGSMWAAPLYRRFVGRSYVEMRGRRIGLAIGLGLWVFGPAAAVLGLWHLGGHGPLARALKKGLGVLWASLGN